MQFLDLTLPAPAENIALDEALLEEAEAACESGREPPDEVLRLWEPAQTMVVLGRSSQWRLEVNREACRGRNVPVLRRSSGGAAVVTGPGCLMYSLVLSYARRPRLRDISQAHCFVLGKLAAALQARGVAATCAGTSDLALHGKKFSGNSLHCRREFLLYHGTLLYDFPLELVAELLRLPPRQPAYRAGRPHQEFLINLPLPRDVLCAAVREAFSAIDVRNEIPQARMPALVEQRYGCEEWTWGR